VVAVGRAAETQHQPGATGLEVANAGILLAVLARALGAARAAFLLEEGPERTLVPVAFHGRVHVEPLRAGDAPGGGPWSLCLPCGGVGGDPAGLLLLARPGGAPLPPGDRALAESMAEAIASLAAQARTAAELGRTRELLARADQLAALGTLAAAVAHDIRNPLVSVLTFIQLLPERRDDEEFWTTFRALALDEIERICALINDLLAFSRPTAADRGPSHLNEVVAQVTRLLDVEARKRDVLVVSRGDPRLPRVVLDEARVKQVLLNVVLNAIQASPPGGTVDVATRARESHGRRWAVVDVADTGLGIPPEHRDQIFDPFFTTKDAGSGLGLFIAQRIVGEHGGHIATMARAGGGTVFSVHFPLAPLAARQERVDTGAL
jgi:signal transduction histidine kinase